MANTPFRPILPQRPKVVHVRPSIRVKDGKVELVKAHQRSRPSPRLWPFSR